MLSVQQWIKNSMTPILHPLYSPDLAPSKYFLFPQMKKALKRKHFADVEEVKQTKQKKPEALKGTKINELQNCFQQQETCLNRCVASN